MTAERPYHKFIRAFEIFARYPHTDALGVGHDTIYAGPDPQLVTPEDVAELETLGWIPAEDSECFLKFV